MFLDTGNPLITVPSTVFTDIVALTGAVAGGPGVPKGLMQLPSCSSAALAKLPTISFHIGGRAYPLTPQQYVYEVRPSPYVLCECTLLRLKLLFAASHV